MATTTTLNVSAVDNELIVTATTPAGSSEVLHIKSGYGSPVSYHVNLHDILPAGSYTLVFVGINWGGPSAFAASLTTGGAVVNVPGTAVGSPTAIGVVWTASCAITV